MCELPNEETREELEARYRRALEDSAKQLSYRALTEKGLRDKLTAKGHAEDAAEYAIAWLLERGLLCDSALADATVRSYGRKGYGRLRIRQELKKRGVDAETAETALEDFDADLETMTALLDKRLKGDLSDRKEVNKAVAALQRRGFVWEDIRKALNAYGAQLELDES